jgi:hypothetical protein
MLISGISQLYISLEGKAQSGSVANEERRREKHKQIGENPGS